eukprot:CAMPEP_0173397534 /NCGR_PEP_ID=MMETSP1356-20130122/38733_1 /TAXON_ID=77927 ORGANISM="Hemiselmis virescens, Strain PCC157" /NCGR_SAMPLE_ID=MMETSP1356 /ASSEMBLY_ACC=CAM_ASM_000847 /LENGTH=237 /DNA_ID=CAMNT_0014356813 /DNA_START=48 /DNA_END=758 /DNA_ORIENTATION=-
MAAHATPSAMEKTAAPAAGSARGRGTAPPPGRPASPEDGVMDGGLCVGHEDAQEPSGGKHARERHALREVAPQPLPQGHDGDAQRVHEQRQPEDGRDGAPDELKRVLWGALEVDRHGNDKHNGDGQDGCTLLTHNVDVIFGEQRRAVPPPALDQTLADPFQRHCERELLGQTPPEVTGLAPCESRASPAPEPLAPPVGNATIFSSPGSFGETSARALELPRHTGPPQCSKLVAEGLA